MRSRQPPQIDYKRAVAFKTGQGGHSRVVQIVKDVELFAASLQLFQSILILVENVMGSAIDLRIISLIFFVFYQVPPTQSCGIQDIALKFL